jgi:FAD-linked sulfhydryl oxidase
MLNKPIFDCNNLGDFYDCGCGDDEHPTEKAGDKEGVLSLEESSGANTTADIGKDAFPLVEIQKEP